MRKNMLELYEASRKLNRAAFHYRSLTAMNGGLPLYEYMTKPKPKSDVAPKMMTNHPTKKVNKSEKRRMMEEAQVQALVALRNAQEAFRIAESNVK